MNDSNASSQEAAPWLLLIHQVAPKPDYLRVKIRRRLHRLGAFPLKRAVYVLPNTPAAREDFEWLAREIVADGGEATVCEARFVAPTDPPAPAAPARGRTWVTRRDVGVDRLASAWLVRRFIDADARFKFVAPTGYRPDAGEVRFDMFEGEYTHEGDRCTFETLLRRFELTDPALQAVAEIVHDIDLKDHKFGRAEAAGIATLVAGLVAAHPDDAVRIERGAAIWDDLHTHFSRPS
jgi:hypothetical protein